MEIKKQIDSNQRGGGGWVMEGKGGRVVRNMYKGHMDKANEG